ncbi:hypothetical protein AAG570_004886 [Ranatra chinensis]|uniref:Odorant receptor n=1 Tax=Ranatra chinensis TaxID=642074 RepID=A0ABD0XZQ9_9HEMI
MVSRTLDGLIGYILWSTVEGAENFRLKGLDPINISRFGSNPTGRQPPRGFSARLLTTGLSLNGAVQTIILSPVIGDVTMLQPPQSEGTTAETCTEPDIVSVDMARLRRPSTSHSILSYGDIRSTPLRPMDKNGTYFLEAPLLAQIDTTVSLMSDSTRLTPPQSLCATLTFSLVVWCCSPKCSSTSLLSPIVVSHLSWVQVLCPDILWTGQFSQLYINYSIVDYFLPIWKNVIGKNVALMMQRRRISPETRKRDRSGRCDFSYRVGGYGSDREGADWEVLGVQLWCLRAVGMWGPPRGGGRRTRLALAAVVAALLAATTLALALGPQDAAGLADRSSSVELLTLTVSGIYKLGFYLYKEERFRSLLGVLRRVVEDGDGGDVGAVTARKFAVMYCVSGHVIVTFWCLAPLLDASITGTKVGLPVNGRSLADRGDDPGGVTPGVVFGLEYLLHCLTLFCSAHIYLACDVLFFSVLHAVGLRLQEVNASLRRIGTYSQVDDENTALRACYQHHSDIMDGTGNGKGRTHRHPTIDLRKTSSVQRRYARKESLLEVVRGSLEAPGVGRAIYEFVCWERLGEHLCSVLLSIRATELKETRARMDRGPLRNYEWKHSETPKSLSPGRHEKLLTGWEKLFRPLLVSDMLHAIVSLSFAILHMSVSSVIVFR